MLIYITAPPTKHKKIIRRLHPLASCLLCLLPHCRLTLHPLCLFVCPFVCLFGWLLRCLSAFVVTSCPVALPRHVLALRCVSRCPSCRLVVALSCHRVVALLRCRILSCLVVVLRPLTHLVTPALFDCCVVTLHLVVTACSVLSFLSSLVLSLSSCHCVVSRSSQVASRSVVISLLRFV